MREIEHIVVHCADTYADMNIGVEQIRKWHLKRGWNDVGYHYVIRRNGQIELGRLEGHHRRARLRAQRQIHRRLHGRWQG
jgi:hypothetical protein